nr:hypothetical protein [uncultured Flavobacterium sp.]
MQIGGAHAGIFGNASTRIMGALVACELWNEELNYGYDLASPEDLISEIGKFLRGY